MNKNSMLALRHNFEKLKENNFWGNRLLVVILSLFVGCLNGFFGGGGGMLVVPIFTLLCGLEQKKAHSSAIAVILPLSIASCIVYIVNGFFQWSTSLYVGIGSVVGGIVGTLALSKLSNKWISIIFYCLMLGAGIKMVMK